MNQLDALKQFTTVVADTGDFKQLGAFQPQDATTNPSLILKAVQKPEYAPLIAQVKAAHPGAPMDELIDRLVVRFGQEIVGIIPGRVSMEVDARLSFDRAANVQRAKRIIAMAQAAGIKPRWRRGNSTALLRGKAPNQRKSAGKLSRRISPWRRLPESTRSVF